jgi:mannose-6-phosphate isomerase-like protein (cupin superfamily)
MASRACWQGRRSDGGAHRLAHLAAQQAASGKPYLEFLRSEALSAGLYVLNAGAVDAQSAHHEDEVYVVLAGRSRFTAGADVRDVLAGDTMYVAAGVPHKFHDITERLELIVVFAPSET